MANIRVDVEFTIQNGTEVSFTAPCDCSQVTGLKVYHQGGSKEFAFTDSHGNVLHGFGNIFAAGAVVKVILDVSKGHAYIQNADTNAYLEEQLASKRPNTWMPTAEEVGAMPVINHDNTGCYYRVLDGVVEWINPPLALNEEYRTIERYKGLPVYIKALELDLAPQGSKHVWIASGITNIVSFDGSVFFRPDSTTNPIASYSASTVMNMYGNFVWNITENSVAHIIAKYTK